MAGEFELVELLHVIHGLRRCRDVEEVEMHLILTAVHVDRDIPPVNYDKYCK